MIRSLVVLLSIVSLSSLVQAGVGVMKATQNYNSTYKSTADVCFWYQSTVFTVATESPKNYTLEDLRKVDICDNTAGSINASKPNSILLTALKGNCSELDYIEYAQEHSFAGLMLEANKSYGVNETHNLEIFSVVSSANIKVLQDFNLTGEIGVQFLTAEDPKFHTSSILLWLIAFFCVMIGSFTGPYKELSGTPSEQQILGSDRTPQQDPNMVNLNLIVVVVMVAFISTTLLLLYFFYDYLVYFFMAVFCIASARATYELINQGFRCKKFSSYFPSIKSMGVQQIFLMLACISLPIIWFIFRHRAFAWILQDFLGACFCIHLIQTLKMPNLKVCTVLLLLLFFYDIFFVFITPYFTSNGQSIMVEVATGGGSGEELPLLFKMPQLESTIISSCIDTRYSVLGFGDIIVPAFSVCFVHGRDVMNGDKMKPYFIFSLIGYGVGLAIAFIVLTITQTGQPALLYLVPTTLIPIYIVALLKKQVRVLWTSSD